MSETVVVPTPRVVLPGETHAFPVHGADPGSYTIGQEVVVAYGGGHATGAIGVLAAIEAVTRLGDSTVVLTLVGRRRVVCEPAPPEFPGVSRSVRVSDGERAGTGAEVARSDVLAAARRYRAALAELGYPSNVLAAVPEDPIDASYRLASVLRISEPERQHVLESPTATERLELLATVFARERLLLEATISAGGR